MKGGTGRPFAARAATIIAAALAAAGGTATLHAVPTSYVALKATGGIPSKDGNLHADFKAAVDEGALTVHSNAVQDAALWGSTGQGDARWYNYGATALTPNNGLPLYRFDLALLPGFARGNVELAEVRIHQHAGNQGGRKLGWVITRAWSEGNKNDTYPGKGPSEQNPEMPPPARGASRAHPDGINTWPNQNAEGGTSEPHQSWGPASNAFFTVGTDTAEESTPKGPPGAGAQWLVYTVTGIVDAWRAGATPNHGFCIHDIGNYTFHFREAGADHEPVLFIAYKPAVPEGTLIMVR